MTRLESGSNWIGSRVTCTVTESDPSLKGCALIHLKVSLRALKHIFCAHTEIHKLKRPSVKPDMPAVRLPHVHVSLVANSRSAAPWAVARWPPRSCAWSKPARARPIGSVGAWYLSERQRGTVARTICRTASVELFRARPTHAAYRWGEDGLLEGARDRECRLCFALARWNGRDSILKERLFGLRAPKGNHGEDVKECYYYLDSTPTHSYMKRRDPQGEFPDPAAHRGKPPARTGRGGIQPSIRACSTRTYSRRVCRVREGVARRFVDPHQRQPPIRGPGGGHRAPAAPRVGFRNSWSWGCTHEGCEVKPRMEAVAEQRLRARHVSLGEFRLAIDDGGLSAPPEHCLQTTNRTPAMLSTPTAPRTLQRTPFTTS